MNGEKGLKLGACLRAHMADFKMPTSTTRSLLDLPDAALSIIASCLEEPDKKRFMAACRHAFEMAMSTAAVTLKLDMSARLAGIKKVLNKTQGNVHLKIMRPRNPVNTRAVHCETAPAFVTLMQMKPGNHLTQLAAGCHWKSITKVTIQDAMLRCLVPQFIAIACPQLEQLCLQRPRSRCTSKETLFTHDSGNALPMVLCSSLTQLEIDDEVIIELPPRYHSTAELRESLPNIDTLLFVDAVNVSLIEAFDTKLTRLECLDCYDSHSLAQEAVRPCYNLQHLCCTNLCLPDNTANLKVLELILHPTDADFSTLLQLPSLIKLHISSIMHIQQDCIGHACGWSELHFSECLDFIKLANLNLRGLNKLGIAYNADVSLPNPSDTDSLEAVQSTVTSLSYIGRIVVNLCTSRRDKRFTEYGGVFWNVDTDDTHHEAAAAELISAAAECICPCVALDIGYLHDCPLQLDAVMKWGKASIERVCLGYRCGDIQPHVWQAFKQLQRLTTVQFWSFVMYPEDEWNHDTLLTISKCVCCAAQHYVIPANTSLRMEFELHNDVDQAAVGIAKTFLSLAIQSKLPAGSTFSSIDYFPLDSSSPHTDFGRYLDSEVFWVFVVEPGQSNA